MKISREQLIKLCSGIIVIAVILAPFTLGGSLLAIPIVSSIAVIPLGVTIATTILSGIAGLYLLYRGPTGAGWLASGSFTTSAAIWLAPIMIAFSPIAAVVSVIIAAGGLLVTFLGAIKTRINLKREQQRVKDMMPTNFSSCTPPVYEDETEEGSSLSRIEIDKDMTQEDIGRLLAAHTQVEILDFSKQDLSTTPIWKIATWENLLFENLTTLNFSRTRASNGDFHNLLKLISKLALAFPKLNTLNLSHNGLNDLSWSGLMFFLFLSESLIKDQLKFVDISSNRIQSPYFSYQSMPALAINIDYSRNPIKDSVVNNYHDEIDLIQNGPVKPYSAAEGRNPKFFMLPGTMRSQISKQFVISPNKWLIVLECGKQAIIGEHLSIWIEGIGLNKNHHLYFAKLYEFSDRGYSCHDDDDVTKISKKKYASYYSIEASKGKQLMKVFAQKAQAVPSAKYSMFLGAYPKITGKYNCASFIKECLIEAGIEIPFNSALPSFVAQGTSLTG